MRAPAPFCTVGIDVSVAPDNGEWARHRPADNALTTIGGMLYGRDAERARIREVLDRAGNGQSAVLVVRGEAGWE